MEEEGRMTHNQKTWCRYLLQLPNTYQNNFGGPIDKIKHHSSRNIGLIGITYINNNIKSDGIADHFERSLVNATQEARMSLEKNENTCSPV